MKIILQTAPLSEIRCAQAGDWRFDDEGNLTVLVADLGDDRMSMLIAFHEALEALTCRQRCITDEMVTAFDEAFEAERARGLHSDADEDGDDIRACYHREHVFATNIERQLAAEWGVNWQQYEKTIMELFNPPLRYTGPGVEQDF